MKLSGLGKINGPVAVGGDGMDQPSVAPLL